MVVSCSICVGAPERAKGLESSYPALTILIRSRRLEAAARALPCHLHTIVSIFANHAAGIFAQTKSWPNFVSMEDAHSRHRATCSRSRPESRPFRGAPKPKLSRSSREENRRNDCDRQVPLFGSLPSDAGDAILKLARSLARQAAREDHARQLAGNATNAETRRDLCEVFYRSTE